MKNKFLLGIDGGGTNTRAAITDSEGRLLSYTLQKGGAFLSKDPNAKENVRAAVFEALRRAGCKPADIGCAAAGIAGYDKKSDLIWIRRVTGIRELKCMMWPMSDALIAHKGALLLRPGIIAIAGTGSVVFSITEEERQVRNFDLSIMPILRRATSLTTASIG